MKNKFHELFYSTILNEFMDPTVHMAKLNEIKSLAKEITPTSVYRYRKISDFSLSDFDKDIISLAPAELFNDPYDALIRIKKENFENIISNSVKSENLQKNIDNFSSMIKNLNVVDSEKDRLNDFIEKIKEIPETEIQRIIENNQKLIDDLFFLSKQIALIYLKTTPKIACFSEDISSILMWSHYADSHKGFALEYNLKDYNSKCDVCLSPCTDKHSEFFFPVCYSDERFDLTPFVTYIANHEIYSTNLDKPLIPIDDQFIIIKALLNKSNEWKYEKEWRMMSFSNSKVSRHNITLKPTAIYLGVDVSEINKKILKNLAKEKGIKIYKMYIDIESTEFKMTYKEIE